MKKSIHFFNRFMPCVLAAALLVMLFAMTAFSDEEYIPDEYYEDVQSNAVSGWPTGQAIQASAGVVMDLDTGAFLYSKNCDRQLMPASITKIMTALLVLENADPDAVMTCSSVVYELDENASNTGLQEGEQMTIRNALYTLMLESANDTANALAEYVAGSIPAFSEMMNQKAAALGATGTHFSNPSGLTAEDHYTTAHDMALIAQAAWANENFRTICGTVEYVVPPTNMMEEERVLVNHHRMMQHDSDYFKDWCTGGKTGFTEAAWNTLVTYGSRDGLNLVCVLLHGNGADQNYLETIDLMNYGFDNFKHADISTKLHTQTLAEAMGCNYLGDGAALMAPELHQVIAEVSGGRVATIPNAGDASMVKMQGSSSAEVLPIGTPKWLQLTFNDWPVGSMALALQPVTMSLTYPWHKAVTVSLESPAGEAAIAQSKPNDIAWNNISQFVNDTVERGSVFIAENKTLVIIVFGLVIIVLLLLLLILLLQSTSDYRSRKKNRAAREEAQRRMDEIDAKSTEEIEEELRRAMAEEEERRKKEEWKKDPGLADLQEKKDSDSADGDRNY